MEMGTVSMMVSMATSPDGWAFRQFFLLFFLIFFRYSQVCAGGLIMIDLDLKDAGIHRDTDVRLGELR